jgi:hypothetical protein
MFCTGAVLAISRAQADWRAKKRREFEEKRRRREEREHANTVSKGSSRPKGDGGDYLRAQKKSRLEDHDELDVLHHHHLHHHHHHHHLHHPDHVVDHMHHHHHHLHDPHDLALQMHGEEDGHSAPDHLKDVTDQKVAQARWREQKRRELAERKAKKKNYRRAKRASSRVECADAAHGAPPEDVHSPHVTGPSSHPNGTLLHNTEALSHIETQSLQIEDPSAHVTQSLTLGTDGPSQGAEPLLVTDTPQILVVSSEMESAPPPNIAEPTSQDDMHSHTHAHHHELSIVHTHPIANPHSPSPAVSTLDVSLAGSGDVHQAQSQGLAAEHVLGNPEDDQDMHNNLLSGWQSLDPLTPSH